MDLSILICTYNRAEQLEKTLDGMRSLRFGSDVAWEILVVDNNSTDPTADVARKFQDVLPLRYILEKQQGQSHAQNRGVVEARGELVVFTDDDVDVEPEWADATLAAARKFRDADFFGGRVITSWQAPPPPWLAQNLDWLRTPTVYEGGNDFKFLEGNKSLFVGANMAFRSKVFNEGFRFRTDFGPVGDNRLNSARHGGQDGELQERLMDRGFRGLYVPGSIVHHREAPHRMTRRYARWFSRESGRERRRRDGIDMPGPFWFGVPRYLWRVFLRDGLRYLVTRLSPSSRVWLRAECELARTMGDMMECRYLHARSHASRTDRG